MTLTACHIVAAVICFQLVVLTCSSSLRPPDRLTGDGGDLAAETQDINNTQELNESQGYAVEPTPPSDEQQGQMYSTAHAQETLQVPEGWTLRGNVLGALHALGVQPGNTEEERSALHALGRGYNILDRLLGRRGAGVYIDHRGYHLCPHGRYCTHEANGALPDAEHEREQEQAQGQMTWQDTVREEGNWTVLVDVDLLLPARENPFVPLLLLLHTPHSQHAQCDVKEGSVLGASREGMHLLPLDIELDQPDKVWVDGSECTVSSSRMCEAGA